MTWVLSYPGTPGWAGDQEEQGGTRVGRKKTIKGKKTGTGRGTGETMREGSKSGKPEGESRRGTRQEGGHTKRGNRQGSNGEDTKENAHLTSLLAHPRPQPVLSLPPRAHKKTSKKNNEDRGAAEISLTDTLSLVGGRDL